MGFFSFLSSTLYHLVGQYRYILLYVEVLSMDEIRQTLNGTYVREIKTARIEEPG